MQWKEIGGALTRTFTFTDFIEALAFLKRVGEVCETQQHHADMCIHDYNKVTITTTTHEAGNTVTEKDRILAAAIDEL